MLKQARQIMAIIGALVVGMIPSWSWAQGRGSGGAGRMGRGGLAAGGLIRSALKDLSLTDAQRSQIEALAAAAKARGATARGQQKAMLEVVATGIEGGRINRVALQPKLDALAAIRKANRPANRATLEKLHAILTPAQRAQLVDGLKARIGKHGGAKRGERPRLAWAGRWLKRWTTELQLTQQQEDQIRQTLRARLQKKARPGTDADRAARSARWQKALDAFKGQRFVMDEVLPVTGKAQHQARAGQLQDGMLGALDAVLPLLTPQQRSVLAQKIRARALAPHGSQHRAHEG